MIGPYTTPTFNEVFPDVTEFIKNYNDCGIPTTIEEKSITTLYFLLVARYGNSPIANRDENQFRLKVFSIVFQYAPTWEKRLEIQKALRALSLNEIMTGSKNIYNQAFNPAQGPTMDTKDELPFINQQNVNKYEKSKLDAYATLWANLRTDVTENLLREFSKLFKIVVAKEEEILYDQDCEE